MRGIRSQMSNLITGMLFFNPNIFEVNLEEEELCIKTIETLCTYQ